MTEEEHQLNNVPLGRDLNGKPTLSITVDRSNELKEKDEQIIELSKKIVELESNPYPRTPRGGITWEENQHSLNHVEDLPADLISANTEEGLIEILQQRAKQGDKEAKGVIAQLTRKMIDSGPISYQYEGTLKELYLEKEKPIDLNNMTKEQVLEAKAFNFMLKKRRANWSKI